MAIFLPLTQFQFGSAPWRLWQFFGLARKFGDHPIRLVQTRCLSRLIELFVFGFSQLPRCRRLYRPSRAQDVSSKARKLLVQQNLGVLHDDEAVQIEAFHQAHLFGLGQLLEDVGETLVVHRRGELAALDQRHGAHDGRDFRRVQIAQAGRGGISEVGDFLLLGVTNRWEPVIQHWTETGVMHPERVYAGLLQLAGELATYTRETRRPQAYPRYDHDDLQGCFRPLIADLRRSLSMVLEQNAIPIELQDRNYGVRVAIMPSVELLRSAAFVLAVHADIPGELVRTRLPQQVKIGPVERIRDLVNLHLPGVGLTALPVAPRQLPYNAGYSYFELDTSSELWRQLERSGGLAMHIAGEFPGLRLEFWAIRR